MLLQELQTNAQKILTLTVPVDGYENVSFTTNSGGIPKVKVNLSDNLISLREEFAYNTTANGAAYRGEAVVRCKDTGTCDSNDRTIYVTPDGNVFVYKYSGGSPAYFDSGALLEPQLT